MSTEKYDIIIIGCGPAGVSASLYAARANLKVLVIGGAESALMKAEKIENYYGMESPLSGKALFENGLEQMKRLNIEQKNEEVTNVAYMDDFQLETDAGGVYDSRAVIICTGAKRIKPKIINMDEYEGRGLSYCAVCDAFFYRKKKVAVLGSGAYALHETAALLPVVDELVLLTNGEKMTAEFPEMIKVIDTPVKELSGEESLQKIILNNGEAVEVSGLFIALGTAGASDLARKLGAQVRGAEIVTDEKMATMIPGLYAAGDCTGGVLQVSTAVAEGAKAALAAIAFLRQKA